MVCHHPLQASYRFSDSGKKVLDFSSIVAEEVAKSFRDGRKPDFLVDSTMYSIPCGQCIGCRLERSRQWAMRCIHEASLYEDNCFITLTYNPESVPLVYGADVFDGSNGTLVKSHFELFMKRLRAKYEDRKIRVYGCGEYGDNFGRPHYHACLFNFDFPDKVLWKRMAFDSLYTSDSLERLWGMGFCTVGSVSFDSAAYVARYCTKKVIGDKAKDHYSGRLPEYPIMSRKPGLGTGWFEKWKGDCFPSDYLVVNGHKCKPPRFYDKLLSKEDPAIYSKIKELRVVRRGERGDDDDTYRRLLDREKCVEARFKQLVRNMERS